MPKVRRKVAYSGRKGPSTLIVAAVIGVAVLVVVGLIWLTSGANKPVASGQTFPTKLTPEGFPYKGADNAPVTIIAYSDYKCTHCRDFALEIEPLIDQTYVASGTVKFVAHYYNLSPETEPLTLAAMCAAEQGKFWELDHALFANQVALTAGNVSVFARQAGLDMDAFNKCAQSPTNKTKLQAFVSQGRAAGVEGTPTFFVNGKKIVGALPFENFRAEIEQALAGAGQ